MIGKNGFKSLKWYLALRKLGSGVFESIFGRRRSTKLGELKRMTPNLIWVQRRLRYGSNKNSRLSLSCLTLVL